MPESPTGVIPEELMVPGAKKQVIALLQSFPIPGDRKRDLLFGWARTVGLRLKRSHYEAVEVSGTDSIQNQRPPE